MIKGTIDSNHLQVNKYELQIGGVVPILFTSIGAIESELDDVELPDRTRATGGRQKPGETDVTQPAHQGDPLQRGAMELWFQECQEPVSPLHKKLGVLNVYTQSNEVKMSYRLSGLKITKRALPELDMDNDGEMAQITWTLSYDSVDLVR